MPPVFDTYDEALAYTLERDDQLAVNGVRVGDRYRYFVAPARASDIDMWIWSLSIRSGAELSDLQKQSVKEWVEKDFLTVSAK